MIQLTFVFHLESVDEDHSSPVITTPYVDESESDIVYQASIAANAKRRGDIVTIGIHDLVLNEKCSVFDDENCENVFVSVDGFLGFPPEVLETPNSLYKGEPNQKYSFNFQNGIRNFTIYSSRDMFSLFPEDYPISNREKKQQLAELVGPNSSGE